FAQQVAGIVVAGPDALQVQDGQAARLVHGDGKLGIDDRVHRGSEERDIKVKGPDIEPHLHQFRIDGDRAGYDGDLVEPVGATKLLETRRRVGSGDVADCRWRVGAVCGVSCGSQRVRPPRTKMERLRTVPYRVYAGGQKRVNESGRVQHREFARVR